MSAQHRGPKYGQPNLSITLLEATQLGLNSHLVIMCLGTIYHSPARNTQNITPIKQKITVAAKICIITLNLSGYQVSARLLLDRRDHNL